MGKGYFIIDSCPVPLVEQDGKQLSSSKKKQIMTNYTDSLLETIKALNSEKILLVCSTNHVIIEKFRKDNYILERLVTLQPLPYPGVG